MLPKNIIVEGRSSRIQRAPSTIIFKSASFWVAPAEVMRIGRCRHNDWRGCHCCCHVCHFLVSGHHANFVP